MRSTNLEADNILASVCENTWRYLTIFSDAIDDEKYFAEPLRQGFITNVHDVLLECRQRALEEQKDNPSALQESTLPKEIKRRYEIYVRNAKMAEQQAQV